MIFGSHRLIGSPGNGLRVVGWIAPHQIALRSELVMGSRVLQVMMPMTAAAVVGIFHVRDHS